MTTDDASLRHKRAIDDRNPAVKEFPLSYSQRSMLAATELHGNSPAYNICRLLRITGQFDPDRFRRAVSAVAARHDILRTGFKWAEDDVRQVVNEEIETIVDTADLGDRDDPMGSVLRQAESLSQKTFNVGEAPLFSTHIFRVAENESVLLFIWHHLIFDNHSVGHYLRELFDEYQEPFPGAHRPAEYQYKDFVLWQTRNVEEARLEHQLEL